MEDTNIIEKIAAEHGYELAHGQQSWGEKFFGLLIFVKMSNRKINIDRDGITLYKAADDVKKGLDTVSAQLDPDGPAQRKAYENEIRGIYSAAGVQTIYMEPLPNGYCSSPCCLNRPWFRVTSSIGHVVIGWRKRVISIDWKDSIVKASGLQIFPHEDVTRLDTGIHAWGVEKAVEYVKRLHEGIR